MEEDSGKKGGGKIAVLGSVNMDSLITAHRMPILGETIQGIDNEEQPGGKGANTAAACGNLGADICFLGQLGYEQFTDIIIQELKSKNVDVSYIPKLPDVKTARAFVIIFPNGENSIIIIGGANVAYSKEALREEFVQAIQKSDILLLQREIPEYVNIQGAKIANAAGKLVVLDVGGRDEPLTDELLNCVDILSPNSTELARISGSEEAKTEEVVIKMARIFMSKYPKINMLLKLGGDGSIYINKEGIITRQGIYKDENLRVVDTTGAGDCFTGAFALQYSLGNDIQYCLRFASAAAYLNITRIGAMTANPTLEQVINFISTH